MEYLQPYVYNVIRDVLKEREEQHKAPVVAIHNEVVKRILEDIKCTISEMESDGVVAHCENVNGIYLYRIKKELKNEEDNVQ